MSNIKKKYNEIIKNLEENIENKKDLEYAKKQLNILANAFLDEMEAMEQFTETKFQEIYKKQAIIEEKMAYVEKTLNGIEKDIYDVDDNYDLEIVCPYCNYEFVLDEDSTQKSEIECPECKNVIEIDWDGESFEEGCSGHCSSCSEQCNGENDEEDEDDDM